MHSSTDLVTVAVAIHWFNFDEFYREVKRVLKPKGILAAWTYNLTEISPEIDQLINQILCRDIKWLLAGAHSLSGRTLSNHSIPF